MNWLRVGQNSAPLFRSSGVSEDGAHMTSLSDDCEPFFNRIDDIFNATPMRFCLPHQVRC